jgi:hypothetical protein
VCSLSPAAEPQSPDLPAGAVISRPRRRSLVELVRLALDDERRGSLRRVREYVADNGGAHFDPAAVERVYRAELEWRQHQRKLGALSTLKPNGLRAEIRLAEHLIDKSREQGTDAWRWWTFYRDQARRELASRPPEAGRPKGGRKNCEKLPDLRALGERHQAALWATAEEALAEVRAERGPQRLVIVRGVPRAGGEGGAGEASGASGEVQELIARLRARKEASG